MLISLRKLGGRPSKGYWTAHGISSLSRCVTRGRMNRHRIKPKPTPKQWPHHQPEVSLQRTCFKGKGWSSALGGGFGFHHRFWRCSGFTIWLGVAAGNAASLCLSSYNVEVFIFNSFALLLSERQKALTSLIMFLRPGNEPPSKHKLN